MGPPGVIKMGGGVIKMGGLQNCHFSQLFFDKLVIWWYKVFKTLYNDELSFKINIGTQFEQV